MASRKRNVGWRGVPAGLAFVAALLAALAWTWAAPLTWNGSVDATWATLNNWTPNTALPTLADEATFPTTIPGTGAIITLPSGALINNLIFNNSYTLTGGNLSFGANQNITVATGQTATLATDLKSGGLGGYLRKYGTGTLVLTGDNTAYGPYMDVFAGVVQLVGPASNNSVPGSYFHVQGGTVQLLGGVTVPAGKIIYLSNAETDADYRFRSVSGDNTWGSNVVLHNVAGDKRIGVDAGSSLTITGVVSGASDRNLLKVGDGLLVLANNNTHSGLTRSRAGALRLDSSGALQQSTLDMNAADSGSVAFGAPAAFTLGGLTGSRNLDMGGKTLSIGNNGQSTTYSGQLSGGALVKIGAGTLTLAGVNTYDGLTTIAAGTLKLGSESALGSTVGKTVIQSGATLDMAGFRIGTAASGQPGEELVEVSGSGVGGNGAIINSGGSQTLAIRNLTMLGDTTLSAANRWDLRYGTFDVGGYKLTKVGGSVLAIVSATVVNPGNVDVNAGTFRIEGTTNYNAATPNLIRVASGARFDYWATGATVHTHNVELNGGTLSYNGGGSGTLNGMVTLNANSTIGVTNEYGTSTFTLNGRITGAGGFTMVGATPSFPTHVGTLIVTNASNDYAGDTRINSGIFKLGASGVVPDGSGKGNVVLDAGASAAGTFDLNGFDETINGLSGTTGAVLGRVVNNAVGTTSTLTVGAGNASATFAGLIADNTGTGGILALTKTGTGTQTLAGPNTYSGVTTVSAGVLNIQHGSALGSTAAGTTVASTGQLQLQNGITVSGELLTLDGGSGATVLRNISGDNTWAGPVTVQSISSIQVDAGSLNISGNLTGGSRINKNGAGTLILSGDNSAYTRYMDLNAGTLLLTNSNAMIGTGSDRYVHVTSANATLALQGGITIGPNNGTPIAYLRGSATDDTPILRSISGHNTWNGTVRLYLETGDKNIGVDADSLTVTTIDGTGNLVKVGAGTLILQGAGSHNGLTRVKAGTLQLDHANAIQQSTLDMNAADAGSVVFGPPAAFTLGGLTGSRNLDMGGKTLSIGNNGQSTTYSGQLSGGALVKIGAGTWILSGANTYTGQTTISQGTLRLAGGSDRIRAGNAMRIDDNGTFDLNGQNQTLGSLTCAHGDVLLSGGAALTVGSGDIWANSVFTGTGSLVKNTAGTLTYGANTSNYTGGTFINAGRLWLYYGNNKLPMTGDVTIAGPGTLDLAHSNNPGTVQTIGGLFGAGTVNIGTAGRAVNFVVGNGDRTGDFSGTIQNGLGTVSLTKTGAGTQTLSGASTYSGGTTVTAGKLLVNNTAGSGTGSGNVLVSGGLLGGNGTIGGSVTVNAPGMISAGNSPGHLSIGDAYSQTGTMLVEIGGYDQGATTATGYDWISVGAHATLDGDLVVDLLGGFRPASGDTFDVLTAAGGITDLGLDLSWDAGAIAPAQYWDYRIVAWTGGGEALQLFLGVPEPATVVLLALGAAALGLLGWRRRKG